MTWPPGTAIRTAYTAVVYTIARTLARARSRLASDDRASHDRGQSEVLGVVLLVGLVVVAATTLLVVGFGAVTDGTNDVADSQAERAMAQFDSRASRVALGEASVQRVDMGRPEAQGSLTTNPDDGHVWVETINTTTGATEAEVVNTSLGAVVYREAGTTVAYQGGGVWRSDGGGAVMLSKPEFHFEGHTLSFPVVVTEGDDAIDDKVEVVSLGSERKYPNRTANLTNKVEDVKVRIRVQSAYYEAWAQFFREETDGVVTVNHADNIASVTFLTGPKHGQLANGIVATADTGMVKLAGNGVYIDSYNSSQGSYDDTQSSQGEVTAVGDINSTGSAQVEGDMRAGAVANLSGTTDINGMVYWTDKYIQNGASVSGGDEQIDGVATIEPIDGLVLGTVRNASRDNDNANTSVIQDEAFAQSGELTAGTYYVENLEIGPGDTLRLDTSDGNITIAVEGYVDIAGKGTKSGDAALVNVTGDGVVRIVVAGRATNEVTVNVGDSTRTFQSNFHVGKNARVNVPQERAPQFRVYGRQSFVGVVSSDNSPSELYFEGIIYAPGGLYGSGEIFVKQGTYYGGLVAADLTIQQNAEIHYDRSIETLSLPRSPTAPRLRYMHVSVHRIEVRSGS